MPRKRKTQPGDGGAYANRTDMTQPVRTATGQPYGQAQALQEAQQQQPLPQQPNMDQLLAAASSHAFQPVPINAPTARPNEPIQHGLASGPGGGPEVMANPNPTTSMMLEQLAQSTGNPALAEMARRARQYGV